MHAGMQAGEQAGVITTFTSTHAPLTLARRPRMSVLNSLGVVYPTVSGTFSVVAPACCVFFN